MTPLRRPLREHLDVQTTEREILQVWHRVQEGRRARRSRRPAVLVALSAAALLVALLVVQNLGNRAVESEASGPLAALHGSSERPLSGGAELVQSTELSDGSRVAMRPGAHLAVLENSGRTFVTHLANGHADFSVKPGGPRRWVIECGRATIEVVGTEFSLERSPDELLVDVKHGVVLVRGEEVPDRVRRLVAGESLRLGAPRAPAPPASVVGAAAPPAAAPPAASSEAAGPRPVEPKDVVAPADLAAALYADADRARRSGHASEAAELLEKAVSAESFGHRAALACFTLGRLYLEELGNPARAARAFDRSLLAGPPRGLEEDVRARLVEARAKMGDSEGARRSASEYRARFPGGRRAADVERWSPGD